jgi:hypothetical protein
VLCVGDDSRLAEQELGGVERRGVAESTELRPARPSAVLVLLVEAEEEVVEPSLLPQQSA